MFFECGSIFSARLLLIDWCDMRFWMLCSCGFLVRGTQMCMLIFYRPKIREWSLPTTTHLYYWIRLDLCMNSIAHLKFDT